MIRVCMVEEQTLVRKGFRSLLGLTQDMKVAVAEAHDGEEALLAIPKAKSDVKLLGVQLTKRDRGAPGSWSGFPALITVSPVAGGFAA